MNAPLFYISQLLGYRIFRWLFTFSWLFNFTKFWWYKVTYYTGFNPRPHARGDTDRLAAKVYHAVSIHAPARGATSAIGVALGTLSFQSTPPRGGRPNIAQYFLGSIRFQSTPPRGGRLGKVNRRNRTKLFQSTPPRGGRPFKDLTKSDQARVSIHAPARGATPRRQPTPPSSPRFNPRPRAGGDRLNGSGTSFAPCFNPRPRAGGDNRYGFNRFDNSLFQSTPPRGGRHHQNENQETQKTVSIHAPARGATFWWLFYW